MTFLTESWFWRGTQSAIFYYVTFSPCTDYNYKRKRRRAASRAEKERAYIEMTQPEIIQQPVPFRTNPYWSEEIVAGPGPPKGWKRDSLDAGTTGDGNRKRGKGKKVTLGEKHMIDGTFEDEDGDEEIEENGPSEHLPAPSSAPEPLKAGPASGRPSVDRKQSAIEIVRDTLRSSFHPEAWNFKRYDREDEVLWGVNERITRMWDRAKGQAPGSRGASRSGKRSLSRGRKRATTTESDQYDYYRARNPEINELHPPVVSQLASKGEEVAWMLQPPPSRAVMEGKVRPGREIRARKPLALIGTTKEQLAMERQAALQRIATEGNTTTKSATADLSCEHESLSNANASAEIDDEDTPDSPVFKWPPPPIIQVPAPAVLPAAAAISQTSRLRHQSFENSSRTPTQSTPVTPTSNTSHNPLQSPRLPRRDSGTSLPMTTTTTTPTPPVHAHSNKALAKLAAADATQLPPEWDYFLKLNLPEMPARTRHSLPNERWGE